jgi:hypothetical protein
MALPPGPTTTAAAGAAALAPGTSASPLRPRLRLVRHAGRLRPGLIGTVTITLVFSTLFVLAVLQAVLVQGQLRLDQLDREIARQEAERARFEIDVAGAEAPERIQQAAMDNGLVSPPDVVFLERASVTPLSEEQVAAAAASAQAAAEAQQAAAAAAAAEQAAAQQAAAEQAAAEQAALHAAQQAAEEAAAQQAASAATVSRPAGGGGTGPAAGSGEASGVGR